jgi:hypothetical protein
MLTCSNCGALNRPGPSTCEQCGARLRAARRRWSTRRIVSLSLSTAALVVFTSILRRFDFSWSGGSGGLSVFEMILFATTWSVAIKMTPSLEKPMVEVYYFTKYDVTTDQKTRSKRPATLEAIDRVGGEALPLTVIEVDESQLDADGFVVEAE